MTTFLRSLLIFTALFHIPFLVAVHEVAAGLAWRWPWAIATVAAGGALALFGGRARAGMPDRRRHPTVVRLVDVPYFIHWCACIFTAIPSVLGAVAMLAVDLARGSAVALHGRFYLAAYAVGLAVSAYGILVRRRVFRLVELDVPVAGLDPAFEGYRVAHLSDLHIGALTPRSWGERWARASNASGPDLVVVTGDMVTSGVEYHGDITEVVALLEAPDGVIVSMGNHDYFGEGEPLVSMLRARGVRVLRNEGTTFERAGGQLHVAAIDDTWTRRADMDLALRDRPRGVATVLLAHDPVEFPRAVERGVALTLSGHTHGGQIAMPFLARHMSLSHLAHRYHLGIYRDGASTLYVHPGLGTTGPPIRIGVAPAVIVHRLRAA